MPTDARSLPTGTVLEADLCVIGGGPAGLTTAAEAAAGGSSVIVLESGGEEVPTKRETLTKGRARGQVFKRQSPYLQQTRKRVLGGLGRVWHGHCRSFDPIDLRRRSWVQGSGWPITVEELKPYYARAGELAGTGPHPPGGSSLYLRRRRFCRRLDAALAGPDSRRQPEKRR